MLQGGLCEQRRGAALPLHTADSSCLHNTEPLAKLFLTGLKPVEEPTLKQIFLFKSAARGEPMPEQSAAKGCS